MEWKQTQILRDNCIYSTQMLSIVNDTSGDWYSDEQATFTAIKMAYRRTRQSGQRRVYKSQSRYLKRLLRIPVLENKVGQSTKQPIQLFIKLNLDLDDCCPCLVLWCNCSWHDIWPRGVRWARYSANVTPPLPGSLFDDISPIEFLNYWGYRPQWILPLGRAEHKHFLQCSYLDRVYQQSPTLGCSPLHLGCICTLYVLRVRLDW